MLLFAYEETREHNTNCAVPLFIRTVVLHLLFRSSSMVDYYNVSLINNWLSGDFEYHGFDRR